MARILIIDDEAPVRRVLRDMLEGEGHQVWEAPDGAVAMRCWREQPVDLIITDILMPEKDGLELIREIRRAAPGTKVIAMSGGGPQFHVRLLDVADRLGAASTLQKPFAMTAFLDTVNSVLQSLSKPAGSSPSTPS